MPIRLTCPSCSATLAIKDEHAGRAAKCPKCGAVIPPPARPPQAPGAGPAPRPEPEPEPPDEPPRPAEPRIVGRAPGRAADPPPRPKKPRADRDDEGDDRPRRRPPPPRGPGMSGVLIVFLMLIPLFTCCGGLGYAGWWAYTKFVKLKDDVVEAFDKWEPRVNANTFAELDVGETTRAEAEGKLGGGRIATDADLTKAFAHGGTDDRNVWTAKAAARRVVVWQNGDDFLIAAFHPAADGPGRLQAKQWRPRSGAVLKDGELDDAAFEKAYPPGGGPGLPVSAAELTGTFRDDRPAADRKFKRKWLLVEGKVADLEASGDDLWVELEGARGVRVRCAVGRPDAGPALALSVGQTVRIRGKCKEHSFRTELERCTVAGADPDPTPAVAAGELLAAFAARPDNTARQYVNRPLTVTAAVFLRREDDVLIVSNEPGGADTFRVKLKGGAFRTAADRLNPGDTITVKGVFERPPTGFTIKDARVAP